MQFEARSMRIRRCGTLSAFVSGKSRYDMFETRTLCEPSGHGMMGGCTSLMAPIRS